MDEFHPVAESIITFSCINFYDLEFNCSAHTRIGENGKLSGGSKSTNLTHEVEQPVYKIVRRTHREKSQ